MTDFVLEQARKMESKEITYLKIFNYAKFLKQPLKLEMFVLCDGEGNVLKEPCKIDLIGLTIGEHEEIILHQQAKEKVLFKEFESVDTRSKDSYQVRLQKANISGSDDAIQNDFAGFYFYDSRNEKSRVKTIECLLGFHPLELTESAIKQFM